MAASAGTLKVPRTVWIPRSQSPDEPRRHDVVYMAPNAVGPALAQSGGKLYAVWKGADNDESLWWALLTDPGANWSAQQHMKPVAQSLWGNAHIPYPGKRLLRQVVGHQCKTQ